MDFIEAREALHQGKRIRHESMPEGVDCGSCADSDLTAPIQAQANPRASFAALWDRLNGKKPGCSWAANPWVWVIEYANPEVRRHA